MKNRFKISLLLSLAVCLSLILSTSPGAYAVQSPPPYGGRYINGIRRVIYWLDPSTYDYTWKINTAVNAWVNMPSPIWMIPVSAQWGSHMEFWGNTNLPSSVLARTRFFTASDVNIDYEVVYNGASWWWAKIELNKNALAGYSNNHHIGTIAHEMGHAFGLDHANQNPYSIMCQTGSGRITQRPQEIDDAVVRWIYR